jgi:hypothetical protein
MKRQDTKIMSEDREREFFKSDIYGCECKKDRNLIMLVIFGVGLLIGLIFDDLADRAEEKRKQRISEQVDGVKDETKASL